MTRKKSSDLPSVEDAHALILDGVPTLDTVEAPLGEALGAVLAEAVTADVDLPPFDCSAMDGYAVRAADLAELPVVLPILERLTAGRMPTKRVEPGTCSQIMTGGVVPDGADAVVMVEHTERVDDDHARFLKPVTRTNIRRRAEEMATGRTVLEPGAVIRVPEIGLLASVGREQVRVVRRPTVAILATGDELVAVAERPGPGQIRDSNTPTLLALCARAGLQATAVGVARDNPEDLAAKVRKGLDADVLLVSAGVSVGEFDLVPQVLTSLGAQIHLHGIRVKPGKPVAFCTAGERVIFGVPGKPVSTIVAFGLFILPALRRMAGVTDCVPKPVPGVMKAPFKKRAGRRQYDPARLDRAGDHLEVEALPNYGSSDLVALSRANALLVAPDDAERLEPGDQVDVIPFDEPTVA